MMRVVMMGAGYVGLVSAACFAELGHDIVCVDKDRSRIRALERGAIPFHEPGLEDLIRRHTTSRRLRFADRPDDHVAAADIIGIAVGTPSSSAEAGGADLTYVREAVLSVLPHLRGYSVIMIKSTVPIGTGTEIEALAQTHGSPGAFSLASNPEFLSEGRAVQDFMEPSRIVIGVNDDRACDQLRRLYAPLTDRGLAFIVLQREAAELAKYAANAFLAVRLSFVNEIADLGQALAIDSEGALESIGFDPRIGRGFLKPGPGYGGSCLPKDCRALSVFGQQNGVAMRMVEAANAVNEARKQSLADRVEACMGISVSGRPIAVLGLTYKAGTDDMRESCSHTLIAELTHRGADLRLHDPIFSACPADFDPHCWRAEIEMALEGADAAVILTEWDAYKNISADRFRDLMHTPCVIDFRNVLVATEAARPEINYYGLGRMVSSPTDMRWRGS